MEPLCIQLLYVFHNITQYVIHVVIVYAMNVVTQYVKQVVIDYVIDVIIKTGLVTVMGFCPYVITSVTDCAKKDT